VPVPFADQHVAIALLHQPPRLLQRGVGIGSVVLDHQFDLASGDLALRLVEIELHALDHLLAARGDHASKRRQQADLDRAGLRLRAAPGCGAGARNGQCCGGGFEKLPAVHSDVLS
jgi:hypothetical protein